MTVFPHESRPPQASLVESTKNPRHCSATLTPKYSVITLVGNTPGGIKPKFAAYTLLARP